MSYQRFVRTLICRSHPRYYFANGPGHGGYRVCPDSSVLHLGWRSLLCGLHRRSTTGLYLSGIDKDLPAREFWYFVLDNFNLHHCFINSADIFMTPNIEARKNVI